MNTIFALSANADGKTTKLVLTVNDANGNQMAQQNLAANATSTTVAGLTTGIPLTAQLVAYSSTNDASPAATQNFTVPAPHVIPGAPTLNPPTFA